MANMVIWQQHTCNIPTRLWLHVCVYSYLFIHTSKYVYVFNWLLSREGGQGGMFIICPLANIGQ